MKDIKRKFNRHSFFNFPAIEQDLEQMASKGWMLTKADSNIWQYKRIEPQKLHFSITFFSKASAFDPEPSESQKAMWEYCERTGWKLAAQTAQMQIFYNEQESPMPLETDPVVQVENIHRTAKKSFLLQWGAIFLISLLWFGLIIMRILNRPISVFSSSANTSTVICWIAIAAMSTSELSAYFLWYRKARKAAENGYLVLPKEPLIVQYIALVIVLVAFLLYTMTILTNYALRYVLLAIGQVAIVFATVRFVMVTLKRRKVAAKVNMVLTIATSFVISFALMGVITHIILSDSFDWTAISEDAAGTYEHDGRTWEFYDHDLPLRVEDMVDTPSDGYSYRWTGDESLFLGQYTGRQRGRYDAENYEELLDLEYTVTYVKVPALYEMCKQELIEKMDETHDERIPVGHKQIYEPQDATPWNANEVYQLCVQDTGPMSWYLVCYDDHIVEIIFFGWDPTTEQISVAAEKLGAL